MSKAQLIPCQLSYEWLIKLRIGVVAKLHLVLVRSLNIPLNFAIVRGQARLARLQFTIAQVAAHNPAEPAELANYAQAPIFAQPLKNK